MQAEVDYSQFSDTEIDQQIKDFETRIITPGNIDYTTFHSRSPRKDAFITWGKLLEVKFERLEKPRNQIADTIRKKLIDLGLNRLISYSYEVLPSVYKNPIVNRGDDSLDSELVHSAQQNEFSSDLFAEDCRKLNNLTISRIDKTIDCLKEFKGRLEKDMTFEMNIPETYMEEMFIHWDSVVAHFEQSLDKREKITPATHHLLFYAGTTETLSNVYSKYVEYVKEFGKVTPKQVGKILKGRTKKITTLYEPKSQHEAMEMGFYGQQCHKCESWRMDYRTTPDGYKATCFKCGFKGRGNTEYYRND